MKAKLNVREGSETLAWHLVFDPQRFSWTGKNLPINVVHETARMETFVWLRLYVSLCTSTIMTTICR